MEHLEKYVTIKALSDVNKSKTQWSVIRGRSEFRIRDTDKQKNLHRPALISVRLRSASHKFNNNSLKIVYDTELNMWAAFTGKREMNQVCANFKWAVGAAE